MAEQTTAATTMEEAVSTAATTTEATPQAMPFIEAFDLGVKTLIATAYENVTLSACRGEVFAIRGRNGSGKTALLLTLAGRMKPTTGSLRIGTWNLPKDSNKVQKHSGLALFSGLNDLQESLTVRYAVGAELELYGKKPHPEVVSSWLGKWDLADAKDTRVKDLTAEQRCRLGIALAFVSDPHIVVVDDIEDQLTMDQSRRLMELLLDVAHAGHATIFVGVVERELAAMADSAIFLAKEGE